MHASNLFYTEPMVRLAERLSGCSLGGRVFFANSGTEANECAIKIARKHAHRRGVSEPEIVSFESDFHGRTYGSLAATPAMAAERGPGADAARLPLGPLRRRRRPPRGGRRAHRGGPDRADPGRERHLSGRRATLLAAREACDEAGALLILDEIQTGVGQDRLALGLRADPVRPDMITSAKALGGGFPIGACVTGAEAGEVLEPGDHGSTFAAGPVAAAPPSPSSTSSTSRACCGGSASAGPRCGRRCSPSTECERSAGAGLMLGVGLAGDRRRGGRRRPARARSGRQRAGARTPCGCCRR